MYFKEKEKCFCWVGNFFVCPRMLFYKDLRNINCCEDYQIICLDLQNMGDTNRNEAVKFYITGD